MWTGPSYGQAKSDEGTADGLEMNRERERNGDGTSSVVTLPSVVVARRSRQREGTRWGGQFFGLGNSPSGLDKQFLCSASVLSLDEEKRALAGKATGRPSLGKKFGEVAEPFVPHRGASSTMPQKRNPISSEVVLAASKLLRANASLGLDAMVVDFERATGPWHLEWVAIPEAFVLSVGALHQTAFAMGGLVINTDAMNTILCSTKGLIVGEAVMMGLAPFFGRQPAHDIVYAACKTAIESSRPLLDVLVENHEVTGEVSQQQLAQLCEPVNYLGAAQHMVDDILELSKNQRRYIGTLTPPEDKTD
ncbi:L-Aspartase-like protein [Pyrenochaeta sp. DS3sAY3a]|nr:L-Aspartase-like protein [Pyrenochaeta sp. DS3sAY3a]